MDSLIIELQRDALNEEISVSSLLRKAFVVAKKLKLQEWEKWINSELNGYYHLAESKQVRPENRWEELPRYRWVTVQWQLRLPSQNLIPLIFKSPQRAEMMSKSPVIELIREIEALLDTELYAFPMTIPDSLKLALYEECGGNEPRRIVFKNELHRIQEAVRNTILEWASELDAKSLRGDGLAFFTQEQKTNIKNQKGEIDMKVKGMNSTFGLLNTGDMQVESITINISTLVNSDQCQIAKALQSVTEAVKASQEISSQERTEILERLELLSEQATLDSSEWKSSLIKDTFSALATALSAGGGLAEIWSTWGNVIARFFGLSG